MSQYPIITRVDAELSSLPEFMASNPANQPDTPADLK